MKLFYRRVNYFSCDRLYAVLSWELLNIAIEIFSLALLEGVNAAGGFDSHHFFKTRILQRYLTLCVDD